MFGISDMGERIANGLYDRVGRILIDGHRHIKIAADGVFPPRNATVKPGPKDIVLMGVYGGTNRFEDPIGPGSLAGIQRLKRRYEGVAWVEPVQHGPPLADGFYNADSDKLPQSGVNTGPRELGSLGDRSRRQTTAMLRQDALDPDSRHAAEQHIQGIIEVTLRSRAHGPDGWSLAAKAR